MRAGKPRRRRLSPPGSLGPHRRSQAPGLLHPGPRRLPAPRLGPGGGRAGGAVTRAGAPRPPHLEAGSAGNASPRAAPEAPRPPPAPAQVLSRRASAASSPPAGAAAGVPRGGSPGSAAGAAEPAALVPQHSRAADSVRRHLAAPGTLATWRTSAARLPGRRGWDTCGGASGGEDRRERYPRRREMRVTLPGPCPPWVSPCALRHGVLDKWAEPHQR